MLYRVPQKGMMLVFNLKPFSVKMTQKEKKTPREADVPLWDQRGLPGTVDQGPSALVQSEQTCRQSPEWNPDSVSVGPPAPAPQLSVSWHCQPQGRPLSPRCPM